MKRLASGTLSKKALSMFFKLAIVFGPTGVSVWRYVTHSRTWLGRMSIIRIRPNQGRMCFLIEYA